VDGGAIGTAFATDVKDLDSRFFLAFSAHKMLGPTGVGVLWVRPEILERMDPFMSGGRDDQQSHAGRNYLAEPPFKFEAGTPNFATWRPSLPPLIT